MESTSLTLTATFHGQDRYDYPNGCTFTTHMPNIFETTHDVLVWRFVEFLRTMGYVIPDDAYFPNGRNTNDGA